MKEKSVDVTKIIKDLKQNFGGSNEDQMKAVQLLKGLATSDDPKANEFMKAVDKAITKVSTDMFNESVIEITKEITLPGTDIILEKGDKIQIIDEDYSKGEQVRISLKGKMVKGTIVRYDAGNKSVGESPFYVVDVGEYRSEKVPAHKVEFIKGFE